METFTVELYAYPQEFIIFAETEEEAIMKASERFGKSVYESKVLNVEDIEEDNDINQANDMVDGNGDMIDMDLINGGE